MTAITLLTLQEKRQFDRPPSLSNTERISYFFLSLQIKRFINRLDKNHTRTGFLMQLAYFLMNAKFYSVDIFKKRDIQYVLSILQCKTIDLKNITARPIPNTEQKFYHD